MNNKFINNNGANLLHTKNIKKTKVESQIEVLKQQKQEFSQQLEKFQPLQKKIKNLMNSLWISERIGNQFLNELVEAEKKLSEQSSWQLECLIKNEVKFMANLLIEKEDYDILKSIPKNTLISSLLMVHE